MTAVGWRTGATIEAARRSEQMSSERDAFRARTHEAAQLSAGYFDGTYAPYSFTGSKTGGYLTSLIEPEHINYTEIRRAIRRAWVENPQTRTLVGRLVDSVVNTQMYPEPNPAWELLAPESTEQDRKTWARQTYLRFRLWADSTDPSADRRRNFWQQQRAVVEAVARDGEMLAVTRYKVGFDRINPVALQFYDPRQIKNPDSKQLRAVQARGNRVQHGIELTADGEMAAIFLADADGIAVRVPTRGPKSKRQFVNYAATPLFEGQYRGVSMLAPVIHELSRITDYSTAELAAAVLNASIAGAAYAPPGQTTGRPMSGVTRRDDEVASTGAADSADTGTSSHEVRTLDGPGWYFDNLRGGVELKSYDTKRPNVNFGAFVDKVMELVGAAIGEPAEVLKMSFNQNYSASRASLLLFWNTVQRWRSDLTAWFNQPVYEQWLAEEVAAGNIEAPGFNSVLGRRAWTRANWVGIGLPSIDPLKEANAAAIRVGEGFSTRDREAGNINQTDFDDNVATLKRENQALAEALSFVASSTVSVDVEDEE